MRALRSVGVNKNTSSNFRLFLWSGKKVVGGESREMRHVLKNVRRGLKVPTLEGFPDWLTEIVKKGERETGTRTKFSPLHGRSCGIKVCTCSVGDTTEMEVSGRNSIARGDLTLCIVHWIYLKGTQMCARSSLRIGEQIQTSTRALINNSISTRQFRTTITTISVLYYL